MTDTANRHGERRGWIWGWIGGFIWLLLFGLLWSLNGQLLQGVCAFAAFAAGCVATVLCAPWRHPRTPFWKLLLPIYTVLFVDIALILYIYPGAVQCLGLSAGNLLALLPLLLPFVTLGRQTWDEDSR